MIKIEALHRLTAPSSGGKPLRRFAVYVNNGFRFDLDCTMDAESLKAARTEWARLNQGTHAGVPGNFKMKDVTGKPGWA